MNETILKWYDILSFPTEWKQEVLLEAECFNPLAEPTNPMEHLIKALYDCEALSEFYAQKGISNKILLDTLSDLLLWTKNHHLVTGEIGLSEWFWTKRHLEGKLFRLGRLQFCTGEMKDYNARLNAKKGDTIIEVHIPCGDSLDIESCKESFAQAVAFYEQYFPEYNYDYFTCFSWMLDFNLKNFLSDNSNIIRFQNMFDIVSYNESDSALRYLFTLNPQKDTESSLQKKVLEHINNGKKLFEGYGVIHKNLCR